MDKVFVSLGATNHTDNEREVNDFYATSPLAVDELLKKESFQRNIWECACGMNHLTKRLEEYGYIVRRSDILNRVNDPKLEIIDFLNYNKKWTGDIITNPPYKLAKEFVLKALSLVNDGAKIAMFLKLLFLESENRYNELFKIYPPKKIYVFSKRIQCEKGGDFSKNSGSAICFAWYLWEKGYKGFPQVDWINTGEEDSNTLWTVG